MWSLADACKTLTFTLSKMESYFEQNKAMIQPV